MMAKNFQCSPKDILDLNIDDFNEYLAIMNQANGIAEKNHI